MKEEIHIGGNICDLPHELHARLQSAFSDIRKHLIETGPVASGTIVADKKGNRHILLEMDSASVEFVFYVSGNIQRILKNGKFAKNKHTFAADISSCNPPDTVSDPRSGEVYSILGKYVDHEAS